MFRYILKRVFFFIPTLFVIALVAFALSRIAPDDPVLKHNREDPFGNIFSKQDLIQAEKHYLEVARTLGVDKPNFYFSFSSQAFPDTLYRYPIPDQHHTLTKLIEQHGNWKTIEAYYQQIRQTEFRFLDIPTEQRKNQSAINFKQALRDLLVKYETPIIHAKLKVIGMALQNDSLLQHTLQADFKSLKSKFEAVLQNATPSKLYIPDFKWYGAENQFHQWFSRFLVGDFGISLETRQPAVERIFPALKWTLVINLLAIGLAYLISIPIGVKAAQQKDSRFDRYSTMGLFMLYSLPSFWVATLLLMFFATDIYGMNWFRGVWAGYVEFDLFWEDPLQMIAYLLLPVFCIAYHAFAFLTRQMRGSMITALNADYVRTARAKGLQEKQIVWRHAFRNALFPLITIFASIFPAAIVGSVAVEYIFNIPGMGKLMLDTIFQKDWPVVFTILMLGAVLTLVGMLVADILYVMVDPRVSFRRRE